MSPALVLVFMSSGLFLGWSLGANDAANIFGTAVGSGMVTFRRAAVVASIFVILGAVSRGSGGAVTLGRLGAIDALPGAFTVALAAALTVFFMTKLGLPVSTNQSVVGAIIGWNLFAGQPTDMGSLTTIALTWIASPLVAGSSSIILFFLFRALLRRIKLHMFTRDILLRGGLILVGAFGAYSLGANSIGSVMGVFVPASPLPGIRFGIFAIDPAQTLFLLGGVAIAVGIFTYSRHVMETVGSELYHLSPENALVAVLSASVSLFLFSSPWLPSVPVSSSQAVIGAVMGIAIARGGRNIRYDLLGRIVVGWVATPTASLVTSFISLFFVQNLFALTVAL